MLDNLSDQFHNEAISHRIDLLRFSEDTRQKALGFLNDLQNDLRTRVGEVDLFGTSLTEKGQQAQKLIKQTQATIDTAYRQGDKVLSSQLMNIGEMESKYAPRMINDVLKGQVAAASMTKAELEELVSHSWVQGSVAGQWWAKQGKDLSDRFAQQVRIGVASGETNDQIVNRIIGSKTGRKIPVTDPKTGKTILVDEYSKGVMDVSRRDATALVRTAVATISNNVLYWTYLDNRDVLVGIQWLSTLDSRTTPICRSRDGSAWSFDGKPLPQSKLQIPFPGPPPAHWQCRSIIIPITKSWTQLIHEEHGKKAAVDDAEAIKRLENTPGADPEKNVAPSPLPVQKLDLGQGGKQLVNRLAKQTEPSVITPADLKLSETKLDYSKVVDAIQSNARDQVVAVRQDGKLIVIKGQEKVAASVLQNEAAINVKIVDLPNKGRLLGPEIPAAKIPPPAHGLAASPDVPASTRASMDGQVASTKTYESWLKDKSKAFQDDLLGKTKAQLFRSGKLTLTDLVDQTGRPLTLEQLDAKLFPEVTETAGLTEEWGGFSRGEMVRLAGKLGLSAVETREFLVSLGIKPPASSSLYYNLNRGADNDGVPLLSTDQSQSVQQIIQRIKR